MIPIVKIRLSEAEKQAVMDVLDSGALAQGKKVEELESQFAGLCDTKYAIAVCNGTAALHTALHSAGIKKGDEVITTPFTFIATANSIRMCDAVPVFVDVDPRTFNIDPEKIEAAITKKTKAIMPVHLYGQCCDMDKIMKIAKKHNLKVIEDAAQAVGASFNGKMAGSFGDAATFSLYATKNIMCGEGGIVATNNKEVMEKARLFRHHGQGMQYDYVSMGYNYRLTDIHAAIAVEQMKHLKDLTEKRQKNARAIMEGIKGTKGIEAPFIDSRATHVFHQLTIKVTEDCSLTRDELKAFLKEKGIGSAIYYPLPIHLSSVYGYKNGTFPIAEKLSAQVLSLPCHPLLEEQDIQKIIEVFREL